MRKYLHRLGGRKFESHASSFGQYPIAQAGAIRETIVCILRHSI
jgi:hypothetical protein